MEVFDEGVEHGDALVLLVVVWDFDLLVFEVLDKGSVVRRVGIPIEIQNEVAVGVRADDATFGIDEEG